MAMKSGFLISMVVAALAGCATSTRPGAVNIGRPQLFLVPAAVIETSAATTYLHQGQEAESNGKLIMSGPEYDRLVWITRQVSYQTGIFRSDLASWKWELMLIDQPVLNASCMPGGKVTFYTGIIRRLQLTDDEIAVIIGHEIAHALREHGRERMSVAVAQGLAVQTVATATKAKDTQVALTMAATKFLVTLPNSREQELEADKMGLELAARAGYNPEAAITLWQKMQMSAGNKATPEFFSTHPATENRIDTLATLLPTVMPLYIAAVEQAKAPVPARNALPDGAAVAQATWPANRSGAAAGGTSNETPKVDTMFTDFTGTRCEVTETVAITKIGAPLNTGDMKGMCEVTGRDTAGNRVGPAYFPPSLLFSTHVKAGDRICLGALMDLD